MYIHTYIARRIRLPPQIVQFEHDHVKFSNKIYRIAFIFEGTARYIYIKTYTGLMLYLNTHSNTWNRVYLVVSS